MLVKFMLRNYKIFKEEAVLSLVASSYDKTTRVAENTFEVPRFGLRLLKSAVIYGANTSGKSKLFEGMRFMKHFVITSSKGTQKGDRIDVEPFLLSTETENEPSEFEITFIYNNELFRYGFELDKEKVIAEWLYHRPKTKEVELFYREEQEFVVHRTRFKTGKKMVEGNLVRPNALLLSVAAQFNDKLSGDILSWFRKFNIISGIQEAGYQGFTLSKTKDEVSRWEILQLLKEADMGIDDLNLQYMNLENMPKNLPEEVKSFFEKTLQEDEGEIISDVITDHKKYDENLKEKGRVKFSMEEDESSGTRKFFALSSPILETLKDADILAADELDAKLHPVLVCKLVELFNHKANLFPASQLIFNTHDTNLLSSGLFRRDQIWFTEKNRYGAATLYSLADFKTDQVRKEDNFEKNYIQGRYGAIPFLGDFSKLFPKRENALIHEDEG
jgi:AAA15 family ATPase/GTPase